MYVYIYIYIYTYDGFCPARVPGLAVPGAPLQVEASYTCNNNASNTNTHTHTHTHTNSN